MLMSKFWIKNSLTTISIILSIYGFISNMHFLITPLLMMLVLSGTKLFQSNEVSNSKLDSIFFTD